MYPSETKKIVKRITIMNPVATSFVLDGLKTASPATISQAMCLSMIVSRKKQVVPLFYDAYSYAKSETGEYREHNEYDVPGKWQIANQIV